MTPQEQKQFFDENGYLLVPGVLTREQVASLRETLRPKFNVPEAERQNGDSERTIVDVFSRHPEIRWLMFHEPSLKIIRNLLGDDFVVLREVAAHFEMYGGWHKDTTSQEQAGNRFQWDDDYLMVEVAYYLQDNAEEYGGGLDVQPGSHRETDHYVNVPKDNLLTKICNRIVGVQDESERAVSIPSKAGDLVIFHFRTNHRATQRKAQSPPERQKMAVFIACSRNTPHVQKYHDFITSRPTYTYLHGGFSYPADLVRQAKANGVNMP